jgi:hypothetical protein
VVEVGNGTGNSSLRRRFFSRGNRLAHLNEGSVAHNRCVIFVRTRPRQKEFLSESTMQTPDDEIRTLKAKIGHLEDTRDATESHELKLALTNEICAKETRLNTLQSQQGSYLLATIPPLFFLLRLPFV